MSEPILTVANQLTILRMAAVPLLVVLVLSREYVWALVVFLVAGLSDLLDGLVARLGHQRTTLGAFLDPIADKVLLSGAFIALTWGSGLHARIPLAHRHDPGRAMRSSWSCHRDQPDAGAGSSRAAKLTTVSQLVTAGRSAVNALTDDFPPMAPVSFDTGLTVAPPFTTSIWLAPPQGGGQRMKELLRSSWARLGLALLAAAALLWGLSLLGGVVTPFAIAFALAYFLNPPVNAMERFFAGDIARSRIFRGRLDPRAAAVAILCIGVILVLGLVIAVVVPAASHQISEAAGKLPGYLRSAREKLEPIYERLNLRYPEQAEELRVRIETAVRENALQILTPLTHAIQAAFSSLLAFVLSVLNLLVVPVFAVYLLYDMNQIHQGIKEMAPHRYRPYLYSRFAEVDRLLSAFVRGQITVCLILGAFYALGLTFSGVPMGLVVGFVIGFFNMISSCRTFWGCRSGAALWLTTKAQSLIAVTAPRVRPVEAIITPRIVGQSLGLHAVIIMLAVLIGGTLFGLIGMLIAVPLTAVLSVFWADLRTFYLGSEFYRRGAAPEA
jgi:predicted PurR-regulated permease PerM